VQTYCSVQNHFPTFIGIFENSNFKLTKEALCLESPSLEKPKFKTDSSESESSIAQMNNPKRRGGVLSKIIKKARQTIINHKKEQHNSRDSGSRPNPRVSKTRSIKTVMRPNKRIQSLKRKEIAKKKAIKGIINLNCDHRKVMKYIQKRLPNSAEEDPDPRSENEEENESPTVADHHRSISSDFEVDLLVDPFSPN